MAQREQHPARATVERTGQRDELVAPTVDRAEVAGERIGHRVRHLPAVAAEAGEIELVEQRGVERDELIALEAMDPMRIFPSP